MGLPRWLLGSAPRVIRSKVAGVTMANPDGSDRQKAIRQLVRPGRKLLAVPEPDNPVDPNAVGLWARGWFRRRQIGYLKSDLAEELAGKRLTVEVLDVTGGTPGKPTRGVNISITFS